MKRRAQHGFTLVELMVVIAIIAVLATLAVSNVRSKPRPYDVASQLSNLLQTGSRTAVRYGPVRADVMTSLGSKRRARLTASGTDHPLFVLAVLVEDPSPVWQTVATYQVPPSVKAVGYAAVVGNYSIASPSLQTDWSTFEVSFEPTGSATPMTLFLSSDEGAPRNRQARVSVLPLGTATFVRESWQ
jgi:prepilin-type N-terminal cleavage/methylation domain-containing protein